MIYYRNRQFSRLYFQQWAKRSSKRSQQQIRRHKRRPPRSVPSRSTCRTTSTLCAGADCRPPRRNSASPSSNSTKSKSRQLLRASRLSLPRRITPRTYSKVPKRPSFISRSICQKCPPITLYGPSRYPSLLLSTPKSTTHEALSLLPTQRKTSTSV